MLIRREQPDRHRT